METPDSMAPHVHIPAAVFAHLQHQGQSLTVVKLQEAYAGEAAALSQQLSSALGLEASAPLLVLPAEGGPLLDQGGAAELYHDFLSTVTDAVSQQRWQPLG